VVASEQAVTPPAAAPVRRRPSPAVAPARVTGQPSWEGPLRALVEAGPAPDISGTPLAVEVSIHGDGPRGESGYRLLARLLRPGARAGW
jgi:hypothetical protein